MRPYRGILACTKGFLVFGDEFGVVSDMREIWVPRTPKSQLFRRRRMTFLITLIVTIVCVFALRTPIHKFPWLFYALAIIADVVFIYATVGDAPRWLWLALFNQIQKCILPLAMFVIVMFIGCFSKESKVSKWLRPIRAELSIIAWILSLGHMVIYMMSYLPRIFGTAAVSTNVMCAFVVAVVLLILLLVLGVTSFGFVKRRMKTSSWIKLQKWSYVFFGLTYVHLMLMLFPSALHGGKAATISVCVYSVVFIGYAIWRVIRWQLDKKAEAAA